MTFEEYLAQDKSPNKPKLDSVLTDKGESVFSEKNPTTGQRYESFTPFSPDVKSPFSSTTPTITGQALKPYSVVAKDQPKVPQTVDSNVGAFSANRNQLPNGFDERVKVDSQGNIVSSYAGGPVVGKNVSDYQQSTAFGAGGISAPDPVTGLTSDQQKPYDDALQAEIDQLTQESQAELDNIRLKGKQAIGATTAFLAKAGAIGRTIAGAPIDSNLGILSTQNQMIEKAISEEQQNLKNAIASAKSVSAKEIQTRIKDMNDLMQKNFDNAFKLLQEERMNKTAMSDAEYKERSQNLSEQRLDFDIQKANTDFEFKNIENNRKNMEDIKKNIKDMAEAGVNFTELSVESLKGLEEQTGITTDMWTGYFQAIQNKNALASAENVLKLQQIEQNIENSIRQLDISQQQANTSAFSVSVSAGNLGLRKQELELAKEKNKFSITSDDRNRLVGSGLTIEDVNAIETNLRNNYSIDEILTQSDLSDSQKNVVKNTLSGITATQEEKKEGERGEYLNKDFLKSLFTKTELEKAAADAGFGDLGKGIFNLKDVDTEAYLGNLEKIIKQYRDAGYSDDEILKMMK